MVAASKHGQSFDFHDKVRYTIAMFRSCVAIVATALATTLMVAPTPAQAQATRPVATVVWWQGPNEIAAAPAVAEVVQRRGVAWIEVSPRSAEITVALPQIQAQLARGITAYEALQFTDALRALGEAARSIDAIGGQGVDAVTLSDVFLYRALAGAQTQAPTAWDDFILAATLGSARVLDASRFAPRVVEEFARARIAATALTPASVRIELAPRCEVWWDGQAVVASALHTVMVETRVGVHWLATVCLGRRAVAKRLIIDQPQQTVVGAGSQLLPPTVDELRISAQVVTARPYVSVVVLGGLASIMKRNGAGILLTEVSQTLATPTDVAMLVATVDRLLRTDDVASAASTAWYQRPWVWAVAGAVLTGAVLTPFVFDDTSSRQTVNVRPKGLPPW